MNLRHLILLLALLASGYAIVAPIVPVNTAAPAMSIADISDAYIRLTLEAGTHEAEYVDAYYGPPALQAAAKANPRSLVQLIAEARTLTAAIDAALPSITVDSDRRRAVALRGMLIAADTRLQMLQGRKFAFNDEARGQFATVPDLKPLAHFDAILANLETLIPGYGPLAARVDAFNERYVIPKDRLQPVFDAAIAECRRRTAQYIQLPAGEAFVMEFVTGKPWSGYNYYKGNYKSLIQINTDLPIRISRAVDLGCHEGYPGHHVLNLMVEEQMARKNGWKEYEVNPLYSPTSVLSEGSANYGIDLAFPAEERLAFERDILYPIAGLDPKSAQAFWQMQQMTEALLGARLTIARMYLDGEITRPQALELTQKYLLLSPARAEQSVKFTDHYRSYVINYGWGKDLVRAYIERGNPDTTERWRRMEKILSEPTVPADLLP
ncbi:hypothetical protein [Sphingorhabdus wooponensis]|jgi:hypothetical protein|uniref:hypothetical protein n=1 Tax=Sphingorhabdus wooponensis TaxID=940136 RepID=UPI00163B36DA|nr:hypothetical protein [Sphingorhabdus wooponensis]